MKIFTKSALMVWIGTVILPVAASAQESRLSFSFTPSVVAESGDSQLALGGSAAYRFAEHFSFEGDITWIDAAAGGLRDRNFGFDPRVSATGATNVQTVLQNVGAIFGGGRNTNRFDRIPNIGNIGVTLPALPISASSEGQTWIGTMGLRYEPAVQTARFRPYLAGGIGVNFTDQRLDLSAVNTPVSYDDSHSGLALSAGGGANIHLGGPLWANADARYFHLSRDRDLMRLGGGVTFKF